MKKYIIDALQIKDWESFHDCFSKAFDFPAYYGKNLDAWIDCMSDLESIISLQIDNVEILKTENQDIYNALIECTAFVNWRYTSEGGIPIIALSFYK